MKANLPHLAMATLILAACATDSDAPADGPSTVTETIGDTTVVRTLSGSVWEGEATLVPEVSIGELEGDEEYLFGRIHSIAVDDDRNVYVFDRQAHHVRVYDSEGVYVETLGRRGEGPGEFANAEAIAVLPDGRLVVRDIGNRRIQLFGPGDGETEQWGYNPGNFGSNWPLHTDEQGRTYLITRDLSRDGFAMHVIVFGPDGVPIDTLPEPAGPNEPPTLTAESGGGLTSYSVPFAPSFQWTIHPSGHFLTGLPSEYRIDLARDDGVLRIERVTDPVPILDDERAYSRDRVVRTMRNTDPNWNWDGPPIPEHKPFFGGLSTGRNGRIWVRLVTEGYTVENENHDPSNPRSTPVFWQESIRYDVFEPDGTYLGVVAPPDEFSLSATPVFDGDHVWAVTRDELDVERVVRYRIVVGGGTG